MDKSKKVSLFLGKWLGTALLSTLTLLTMIILFSVPAEAQLLEDRLFYSKDQVSLPKIASDPGNGNLFVVFTARPIDSPQQRIMIRQIRVPNPDAIKLGKTMTLTTNGDSPAIAFNHKTKRFLVVWDDEPYDTFANSSIWGQNVSIASKLLGGKFRIVKNKMVNVYPNLIFNPTTQGYLLFWQEKAYYVYQINSAGLYTMMLNASGRPEKVKKRVAAGRFDDDANINLSSYTMSIQWNTRAKRFHAILCNTIDFKLGADTRQYYLYSFNKKGSLLKTMPITIAKKDGLTWYAQLTVQNRNAQAYHYLAWSESNVGRYRKITSTGATMGSITTYTNPADVDYIGMCYNRLNDVYLLISESDTGLWGIYIRPNGSRIRPPVKISANTKADKVAVAWHPKLREFVVIYVIQNYVHDEVRIARLNDH